MVVFLGIWLMMTSVSPFPLHPTVPGAPKDIIATPINSTTINVRWSPPDEKERNGIIRGYHIHVQEASLEVNSSILFILEIKVIFYML